MSAGRRHRQSRQHAKAGARAVCHVGDVPGAVIGQRDAQEKPDDEELRDLRADSVGETPVAIGEHPQKTEQPVTHARQSDAAVGQVVIREHRSGGQDQQQHGGHEPAEHFFDAAAEHRYPIEIEHQVDDVVVGQHGTEQPPDLSLPEASVDGQQFDIAARPPPERDDNGGQLDGRDYENRSTSFSKAAIGIATL